jgi:hypothetical protein
MPEYASIADSLDPVRDVIRLRRMSYRTEQTYLSPIRPYTAFRETIHAACPDSSRILQNTDDLKGPKAVKSPWIRERIKGSGPNAQTPCTIPNTQKLFHTPLDTCARLLYTPE